MNTFLDDFEVHEVRAVARPAQATEEEEDPIARLLPPTPSSRRVWSSEEYS